MINSRGSGAFINAFLTIALIFVFSACATSPATKADTEQGVAAEQRAGVPAQELKTSATTEKQTAGKTKGTAVKEGEEQEGVVCLCEQYTVKKGDSLWWIAKYKDIYSDPFLWPIIYEANKEIIKDPKLLYPGQELGIPREGYTMDEIKSIRKKAGAAKPYLPRQQANLPVD
ncbi:MAG: LysM peptidoglycan-binding domain-containing protein [Syntrophales bacterium]|jgi:nucleoid-associated protein YgaU